MSAMRFFSCHTTLQWVLASFLFLATTASAFGQAKNPPATLPPFVFHQLDGKLFTDGHLKQGKPTIVFFFSPDCDHCNAQTKLFKENIAKLKGSQIVFVTWEENHQMIKDFHKKYLDGVTDPVVTFTQDKDYKIDAFFGESTPPTIFVYDSKRKFAKVFREEAPMDALVPLLK
jgi:cytochrome oxidase Cu insertion factor (SCO1/SenC/PrrC family)